LEAQNVLIKLLADRDDLRIVQILSAFGCTDHLGA
jgi:hypothetical protein